MKLKRTYFIILFSTITLGLFSSCNKNDDEKEEECITNKTEYVTSVNSPATGTVNQNVTIEVIFGVSNGCGGFGKFIETENGTTRIIEVEAKYVGCICTQDAPIRTTNYEFITNTAGNYELKFKSSPTEFITVNLMINW